jgi:hypothetical protein
MRDSFKKTTSDLEEIYFYKLNQELIQNLKNQKKDPKEASKSSRHLKLVSSQSQEDLQKQLQLKIEDQDDVPKKKVA